MPFSKNLAFRRQYPQSTYIGYPAYIFQKYLFEIPEKVWNVTQWLITDHQSASIHHFFFQLGCNLRKKNENNNSSLRLHFVGNCLN